MISKYCYYYFNVVIHKVSRMRCSRSLNFGFVLFALGWGLAVPPSAEGRTLEGEQLQLHESRLVSTAEPALANAAGTLRMELARAGDPGTTVSTGSLGDRLESSVVLLDFSLFALPAVPALSGPGWAALLALFLVGGVWKFRRHDSGWRLR